MKWTPFPYTTDHSFDTAKLRRDWAHLHAGDCEPLPDSTEVLGAWLLFHRGDFHQAVEAGLAAGPAGITVANKAACVHANYLEPREKLRLERFMEAAERAQTQTAADPNNPNAWYLQAYALGRYSQGISVAKALAQGIGTRVKSALERSIALQPRHADAHIALASFHAEVIDKVGSLIGGMTYGASKETGLALYRKALELNPGSAIAMIEYANGLVMLEGDERLDEATHLYQRAADTKPMDALERLEVELAKAELAS